MSTLVVSKPTSVVDQATQRFRTALLAAMSLARVVMHYEEMPFHTTLPGRDIRDDAVLDALHRKYYPLLDGDIFIWRVACRVYGRHVFEIVLSGARWDTERPAQELRTYLAWLDAAQNAQQPH